MEKIKEMFRPDMFTVPKHATNVVQVDGLPVDATSREVAHIFRPYLGYKKIRIEVQNNDGSQILSRGASSG